jgi:transcriptional regulator with XRE-family HTH domain
MSNKASVWLVVMREARNLSQRKLASRVNLANTAISQAENGNASADTWIKLAEYFKVSADAVLWMAGLFTPIAPPKDEIINRLERIIDEMEPETRKKAEQLIKLIRSDP